MIIGVGEWVREGEEATESRSMVAGGGRSSRKNPGLVGWVSRIDRARASHGSKKLAGVLVLGVPKTLPS